MATCAIVSAFRSLAPQAVYGYSFLDSGWYPTVGCRTCRHKCAFFQYPRIIVVMFLEFGGTLMNLLVCHFGEQHLKCEDKGKRGA
jgi:hypothetical protein